MKTTSKILFALAALTLFLAALPLAATAQTAEEEAETATVEQTQPKPAKDPGRFAKGRKRAGFFGGAGSNFGQTYLILGAGLGYYVADGLEVGFDAEGWLLQDPTFWKLTPQVRYVLWQAGAFKPYAGAFYRWNLVGGGFDDVNSYGGRFGVAYQSGGNYLAVGAVYETYETRFGGDNSHWYPEVAVWIAF